MELMGPNPAERAPKRLCSTLKGCCARPPGFQQQVLALAAGQQNMSNFRLGQHVFAPVPAEKATMTVAYRNAHISKKKSRLMQTRTTEINAQVASAGPMQFISVPYLSTVVTVVNTLNIFESVLP